MSYQVIFSDHLAHHGIKGQRWGVRRYRNYDGSYTQLGLKRYDESKKAYDEANEKYKKTKEWYKQNKKEPGAKAKLTNARINKVKLERRTNNIYKHLKSDKRADKGKELYSRGYTITGKKNSLKALSAIGGLAVSTALISKYNNGRIPVGQNAYISIPKKANDIIRKHSKEIAIGGAALAGGAKAAELATARKDRNLRAYYNHQSYKPLN